MTNCFRRRVYPDFVFNSFFDFIGLCVKCFFYIKILLSVHAVALREGGSGLEGERKRGGVSKVFSTYCP